MEKLDAQKALLFFGFFCKVKQTKGRKFLTNASSFFIHIHFGHLSFNLPHLLAKRNKWNSRKCVLARRKNKIVSSQVQKEVLSVL
jgi:hypothetical protein